MQLEEEMKIVASMIIVSVWIFMTIAIAHVLWACQDGITDQQFRHLCLHSDLDITYMVTAIVCGIFILPWLGIVFCTGDSES